MATFTWSGFELFHYAILTDEERKFSFLIFPVIPQTCRYKNKKYECGLSISCVLNGGKPMDLCSGGMIWSCCVDLLSSSGSNADDEISQPGSLNNASEYFTFYRKQQNELLIQVTVSNKCCKHRRCFGERKHFLWNFCCKLCERYVHVIAHLLNCFLINRNW